MKKLLIGAIAVASLGLGQALAADLPYKSPPKPQTWSWTGCFIGANGGYAWGRDRVRTSDNTTLIHDVGNLDGGLGGAQIGCDYQMNQWVMGIEVSYDWAGLNGTGIDPALAAGTSSVTTKVDGIWSFTTRTGMSFNNEMTLLYLRSGFAAVHIKERNLFTPIGVLAQNEQQHFEPAFDIGVGLEHRFTQTISIRAEYNHLWVKGNPVDIQPPATSFPRGSRTDIDIVTVGVNWRFTPWAVSGKY